MPNRGLLHRLPDHEGKVNFELVNKGQATQMAKPQCIYNLVYRPAAYIIS